MTPILTRRGLPVSTHSSALADATFAFEDQVLGYGQHAAALLVALPRDPECGLAEAYAGALHMFRSTQEGQARARHHAYAAMLLSAETRRERSLIAGIADWVSGNVPAATAQLADWLAEAPHDLFAAKLLQHLLFLRGEVRAMLSAIGPVAEANPDDARVLGMLAFALDQNGLHDPAEAVARTALDIAPDPWAHHALAHAFAADGRHSEGREWMRAHADDWAACTSFLYTHNWWHAALFHLALGDRDGALALFHERVWGVRKDYVQDQANAVSLLARLELAGVDVGRRWDDVADHVRARRGDAIDGFLDLHYAYALARAGDDDAVEDMLCALRASADGGDLARAIALVAAQAMIAFARGNFAEAVQSFSTVADDLQCLGGSNVQRALFADMFRCARAEEGSLLGLAA